MEQEIGAEVLFTPHLVPMSRGLLATTYSKPTTTASSTGSSSPTGSSGVTSDFLRSAQRGFYSDAPFVAVTDEPPETKSVLGSNAVHVSASYDQRTGTVIALAALDNLTKGASGGAVHAANIALGLDETAGLDTVGLQP
jgi:N-acetyl-gamma-glutamyl-phosphate reductase